MKRLMIMVLAAVMGGQLLAYVSEKYYSGYWIDYSRDGYVEVSNGYAWCYTKVKCSGGHCAASYYGDSVALVGGDFGDSEDYDYGSSIWSADIPKYGNRYQVYPQGAVTVPSRLGNLPVVAIGQNAIVQNYGPSYSDGITRLILPDCMKVVNGIRGLPNLTQVNIPDSVEYVHYFVKCPKLGNDIVIIDNWVVCNNGGDHTSLSFSSTLKGIAHEGLYGCKSLSRITFNGNAPIVCDGGDASVAGITIGSDIPKTCVVSAPYGTTGWDDDGDGKWCGYPLEYRGAPPKVVFDFGQYAKRVGGGKMVQYVEVGGSAELPIVEVATGYLFLGWYTTPVEGGEKVTEKTIVTGDVTYYARCEKLSLVKYVVGEHGSRTGGGELSQYVRNGNRSTFPEVEANAGFLFLGWFTAAVGGERIMTEPIVSGDATYYAQYEKLAAVVFELGPHGERTGGGELQQLVRRGECAELPEVEPNFGYDFQGWFTAAEGGERVTEQTVVMDDVTYYAHWGKIDLGVNFVLGGTWTIGSTATGTGLTFAGVDETSTSGMSVQLRTKDDCSTWIETTVEGEMWVSFDWKTSCEKYGELELDRIEFSIDGQRLAWLDGESGWTNMTFAVRGEGTHAIRFTYVKDESEYMGEDCAWVANVVMTPKTAVASPVIHLAATYETETTPCVITTDTVGAAIRYRFDYYGDESEWFDYTGPFEISGTTKVIAYATKQDYYDSESVSATCERTKPWTLAECVNAPHLDLVTGGDGDWCRTTNTTHDGVAAIRSGEIGDGEQSWVKVQMLGPGTISFWWKADSEYYKKTLLDFATFKVDGVEISKIGGASDWTQVTHDVSGDGLHTYLWTYTKNAQTAMGEDCAWLDELVWTPDTTSGVVIPSTISGGKDFAIDTDWKDEELDAKFGSGTREKFEKRYGEDVTAAFLKQSGKHDASGAGRYVWQDYVMGTDPTDKSSEFESSVEIVDGVPVITWEPDLGVSRIYKIWGRESLGVGDWQCPTNSLHRFFKVSVEMK